MHVLLCQHDLLVFRTGYVAEKEGMLHGTSQLIWLSCTFQSGHNL